MKRIVRITVEPSPEHPDVLTVQDALQQVLDFFDLLKDESAPDVEWKLTLATTNSPFTVEGEPVDMRTLAGAYSAVEHRVAIVERNFARVVAGLNFDDSFPKDKLALAKRLLRRTTNGIGAIVTTFSDTAKPVSIPATVARRFFDDVEEPIQSLHSYLFARTARQERGSVEGRIVDIGTDYGQPALRLIEHKSGREIWCRIDIRTQEELSESIKAKDAWGQRRVRVRGALNYGSDGKVFRVHGGSVVFIDPEPVNVSGLTDRAFTEGYGVAEYLDRLREDEFGS